MGPFYDVAITLDGRPYTAKWCLHMGGLVNVACVLGADHRQAGSGEKPEAVAAELLEKIVRAHQQKQVDHAAFESREKAKLRRRRLAAERRLADQLAGDDDPMRDALRRLVEQIEAAEFRDENGIPLRMNVTFIEVRELLRGYGQA